MPGGSWSARRRLRLARRKPANPTSPRARITPITIPAIAPPGSGCDIGEGVVEVIWEADGEGVVDDVSVAEGSVLAGKGSPGVIT